MTNFIRNISEATIGEKYLELRKACNDHTDTICEECTMTYSLTSDVFVIVYVKCNHGTVTYKQSELADAGPIYVTKQDKYDTRTRLYGLSDIEYVITRSNFGTFASDGGDILVINFVFRESKELQYTITVVLKRA